MRTYGWPAAIIVVALLVAFDLGLAAGRLAGVLTAFAGLIPAILWEIAMKRREHDIKHEKRRAAALKRFRLPRNSPEASGGNNYDESTERGAAQYLRPEEQIVSFRPRQERDQLYLWCTTPGRHVGIQLVVGDAGVGKTRLAVQLAEDLKRDGWQDMWVERGRSKRRYAQYEMWVPLRSCSLTMPKRKLHWLDY